MELLTSMGIYVLAVVLSVVMAKKTSDHELGPPLYDRMHQTFAKWPSHKLVTFVVRASILYNLFRWNKSILTVYFLSLAIILFMRIPAFTMTQTPPADPSDQARIEVCRRNAFSWVPDTVVPCIDNMFSAHTAHVMAMLTLVYIFSKSFVEKVGMTIISVALIISIVTSRLHYTADVWIAVCLTPLTVWAVQSYVRARL